MFDDYFIPACDCFAHLTEGSYLCESCGLSHVWNCPKFPSSRARLEREGESEPNVIEIGPHGTVFRGKIGKEK